jgi:hypothetical protein
MSLEEKKKLNQLAVYYQQLHSILSIHKKINTLTNKTEKPLAHQQ